MELPIDHFRLLGVSPTTDAQAALQMLQLRLDRVPREGYSLETLDARAELLRNSADLLSDQERRQRYESDLTALGSGGAVIPALDIPSALEVGGLVLLLEAGQPLECFELASRALQPPRAPALGSSRESDLTLVAAQAVRAGADELQSQRRFEAAAQLLLQGQQLLQRTGQLPQQRQQLSDAVAAMAPYRVLDLLSRPLTATAERGEGLRLLAELVSQRGGLDGPGDQHLSRDEFQTFFKQIRSFLTVQEQVDLFTGWAGGSPLADFLATTALTASGFVQRKPERIAAALARLEASNQRGTETLKAALQLLLGQVDLAQQSFQSGASPELLSWAAQQSTDSLAQLCAYCSDWLARDVLPGYRDLEADADLDAYFADRDVQAFIEAKDPSASAAEAPTPVASSNPFEGLFSSLGLQGSEAASAAGALQSPPPEALFDDDELAELDASEDDDSVGFVPPWSNWQLPSWRLPAWNLPALNLPALSLPAWCLPQWPQARWKQAAAVALGAGVLAGAGAITVRQSWRAPQPLVVQPAAVPAQPAAPAAPVAPEQELPLTAAEPSDGQLKALLEAWLAAKAAVLAGRDSSLPLADLARQSQVQRLEAERSGDAARGETQRIEASVSSFEVLERSPNRIAARVSLAYSDSRQSSTGATLARTDATTLVNRYVFARDGGTWRLVAFSRSS
ncbi:MAG: IMS domain-containing protein [Prochlorococcaceae cyanobacterium]